MKIRRQKNARKVLNYFKVEFGFEAPYKVLLDATFCRAALRCQLNISEQLPKYLNSQVQFFTTQCVINECESFGSLLFGVVKVLRQFRIEKCRHDANAASNSEDQTHGTCSATDCILATVRHRDRPCLVATNDRELTEQIRLLRKVPLLFVSHNAISIEKPAGMRRNAQLDGNQFDSATAALSASASASATTSGRGDAQLTDFERTQLKALFKREFPERVKMDRIRAKLRRLKDRRKSRSGPNPLSCKKKKKEKDSSKQKEADKRPNTRS